MVAPAGDLQPVVAPLAGQPGDLLERQVGPLAGEQGDRSCHALSSSAFDGLPAAAAGRGPLHRVQHQLHLQAVGERRRRVAARGQVASTRSTHLVGERVLVAEQVPRRPPGADVRVGRLGDQDAAEARGRRRPRCRRRTTARSSTRSRTPASRALPLTSSRIAFLRPVANRVASNAGQRPAGEPAEEQRRVVDGDRSRARCRRTPDSPLDAAGSGRSLTNVSVSALTPASRSPVTYWARSTMCAPMSPSAPGPGLLRLQPPDQRELRVDDPVLQVLRAHVPDLPDPARSATSCRASATAGHPPVVEADHRCARPAARARSAAATIARASSTVLASGFSHSTCLPASSAAMAISAWRVARRADVDQRRRRRGVEQLLPVGLDRPPAQLRRGRRRRPPRRGRRARPVRAAAAGRRTRSAVRQACEWAAPMKA